MVEGPCFMLAASKNSEEKKRTLINVHLFSILVIKKWGLISFPQSWESIISHLFITIKMVHLGELRKKNYFSENNRTTNSITEWLLKKILDLNFYSMVRENTKSLVKVFWFQSSKMNELCRTCTFHKKASRGRDFSPHINVLHCAVVLSSIMFWHSGQQQSWFLVVRTVFDHGKVWFTPTQAFSIFRPWNNNI